VGAGIGAGGGGAAPAPLGRAPCAFSSAAISVLALATQRSSAGRFSMAT
jgi:hypothetical protein